ASLVLPRSFLRSGRVSPRTLNGPAATGSGGRLDLALDDPFVVGHRHAVGLVVDHVDGLVGGGGDGGLRALHALHVFGLESDLGAVGQTLVSGVLDLFLHDPLVILDRIPAGGGREVHRVGVGVERAGDRGVCAVHALHVFGGERDLGAGRVLRRRSLLDALGGGAAVHRMLHPAAVRTAATASVALVLAGRCGGRLVLVSSVAAAGEHECSAEHSCGDGGHEALAHKVSYSFWPDQHYTPLGYRSNIDRRAWNRSATVQSTRGGSSDAAAPGRRRIRPCWRRTWL